jgi:hypothetical protein
MADPRATARYLVRVGWTARVLGFAGLAALAAVFVPACSLGEGTGEAEGSLNVPDCWSGEFNLHPDFFAAIPGATAHYPGSSVDSMQIRIQNGAFYETFSDGIAFLLDDTHEILGGGHAPAGGPWPSLLGQTLVVSLSPSAVPPGVPIVPVADPRIVHATLYLDKTCRTQNDALYALDAVSGVDSHGECTLPEGGTSSLGCPGPATAPVADGGTSDAAATDGGSSEASGLDATTADAAASDASPDGGTYTAPAGSIGQSTITFTNLFDNNPDESDASQRLSEATFNLYFGDPREMCPGGLGPPPPCRGHLKGSFHFYFQRGRPAQPFP